jgi:hypothetical protein
MGSVTRARSLPFNLVGGCAVRLVGGNDGGAMAAALTSLPSAMCAAQTSLPSAMAAAPTSFPGTMDAALTPLPGAMVGDPDSPPRHNEPNRSH